MLDSSKLPDLAKLPFEYANLDMGKFIDIIFQAGNIISQRNLHNVSKVDISQKSGSDNFVTQYDVEVQNFLLNRLNSLYPNTAFMGEESNKSNHVSSGLEFIVDPIDGTTNFIHDYHHSAISIALSKDNHVIFGAVLDPYLGELFYAAENCGAYLLHNSVAEQIHVSNRALADSLVLFGTTPYEKTSELLDKTFSMAQKLFLHSHDIRRSGSAALDICYVAAGRCDLFFELQLSPWDYAAGSVILTEAGGVISTLSKDSISLSEKNSILVANKLAYKDYFNLTNCHD